MDYENLVIMKVLLKLNLYLVFAKVRLESSRVKHSKVVFKRVFIISLQIKRLFFW